MLVKDVLDYLDTKFPLVDAEEWDKSGLHVGDLKAQVTGICCALDPSPAAIKKTAALGANLLVTHHPVFINAPDYFAPSCTQASFAGTAVWQAANLGVSIISMHTNLDVSDAALTLAATKLGLKRLERLCEPNGYGVVLDTSSISFDELAKRCASAYRCSPNIWNPATSDIERVAFSSGSFSSLVRTSIDAGVDAVICGECGYHALLELHEAGVGAIILGHDASELPYASLLSEVLGEYKELSASNICIEVIDEPLRWHVCMGEEHA